MSITDDVVLSVVAAADPSVRDIIAEVDYLLGITDSPDRYDPYFRLAATFAYVFDGNIIAPSDRLNGVHAAIDPAHNAWLGKWRVAPGYHWHQIGVHHWRNRAVLLTIGSTVLKYVDDGSGFTFDVVDMRMLHPKAWETIMTAMFIAFGGMPPDWLLATMGENTGGPHFDSRG